MDGLVGRAIESARIDALIAAAREGRGGTVALVGEAGIGKTALLRGAHGRANGTLRLLAATGAEAEAELPFAALLSLLRPVREQIASLPGVQRRALEAALALGPRAPGDRVVVHAAVLTLLAVIAEQRPLLVTIDDAQWLDDASADVLMFVARRLHDEPIGFLIAARPSGTAWPAEQVPIGGLSRSETAELIARTHGAAVTRAVVDRLHGATAGNPLALREALRDLTLEQLLGRDPLGDPLPVGTDVQASFRRRLERLPQRTRTALLLLAAAGEEPLELLIAAGAELGVALTDLEPAERDGLLDLAPDEARFREPLARSTVYHDAPAPERRAVHGALAAHAAGVRRALHLWRSASGPDPVAAVALEDAAGESRARTGYSAAALAMERAARLTPEGEARAARLSVAAHDRLVSGNSHRAAELAQRALTQTRSRPLLAELYALLGAIDSASGSLDAGVRMCTDAAESIADDDPDRAAWMLATAALTCFMAGRIALGHETTLRAHALVRTASATTRRIVDLVLAGARLNSGLDCGDGERELLDRWPEAIDERILLPGAPHLIGGLQFLTWVERFDDADAFAARVETLADAAGAAGALPLLRGGQIDVDLRRGDWARARARASEALRIAAETGQVVHRALPLAVLARVEAAMGLEDECRQSVAEVLGFATNAGLRSMNVYGQAALGLLELGSGRAATAVEHLDEAARLCDEYGQRDPSVVQFLPDRIEALARAGMRKRADAALLEYEAMADRTRRRWPLATAARCRGLLAPDDELDECFARAYDAHGPSPSPFELGRTELCHGERLRRARRARESRAPLRAALTRFQDLGAAPWAARARQELRAAGGAVGPVRTSWSRELTAQETEVALAVARGATNREVGAALFVSPRTVEVHLRNIFKKLGIARRTELAAVMNGINVRGR